MNFVGIVIALLTAVVVGVAIAKKVKPQMVLFAGGIVLMIAAQLLGAGTIFEAEKSTGSWLLDVFEYIKAAMSKSNSGIGLIIMTVGGFASYMSHIGAGEAMVQISVKPLRKLGSPYLVLALAYVFGQIMNIFIPSAAGLAVLLMATVYPILVALGVSRLSAAAVVATTACLDLGPASGVSNVASETAGITAMSYFVQYQLPVSVAVIIVIAVLHYVVSRYSDKKMGHDVKARQLETNGDGRKVPSIYAALPILPLILLLIFNEFVITTIKMNVITAMLIGLFIALIFELVRNRNAASMGKGLQVFFDGMGKQFATVVTLIIAAETFAYGLQVIGLIDAVIHGAETLGFGVVPMTIVMTAIIMITAVVTGSGVAAFASFAALAPVIAGSFDVHPVALLLAMQLAAGIARSISPVASCVIAPAGIAEVSPMDISRRTVIPMIGGIITLLMMDFILFL